MANLGTAILALLAGGTTGLAQGKERRRGEEREDIQREQETREREDVRAQQAADRAEERRIRDQQIGIESTAANQRLKESEAATKERAEDRKYRRERDLVEDTQKDIQSAMSRRFLDQEFDLKTLQLQNKGLQDLITVLRATKNGGGGDDNTINAQKFISQGLSKGLEEIVKNTPDLSKDPAKLTSAMDNLGTLLRAQAYKIYKTTGDAALDQQLQEALAGQIAGDVDPTAPTFDTERGAFQFPGLSRMGAPVDLNTILNSRVRALAGTLRTEK